MRWVLPIRRARGCPPGWQLARAVSDGAADPALREHVAACPRCTAEIEGTSALRDRAQTFPEPIPMTSEVRHAISLRLLAARRDVPRRVRRRVGLIAAVAAAAAAVVVVASSRRPPLPGAQQDPRAPAETEVRSRASIRAIGAARFTRIQPPPDDVVQLEEGTIVLEVAPLPPGERFRVRTSDGEVEVRGTRFQVSATHGELLAVSVWHGRVEVISPGGGHAVLEAGDDWVRSAPVLAGTPASPGEQEEHEKNAPASRAASRAASRTSTPGTSGEASPRTLAASGGGRLAPLSGDQKAPRSPDRRDEGTITPARASFERAWALLRQGDPRRAAALFADVEALAQGGGIAEDALYWRGVAIARTGDVTQARRLLSDFLARFPVSVHHGEAATALGWLLLDAGDVDAARRAFGQAVDDPSPMVSASARDGLRRTSGR